MSSLSRRKFLRLLAASGTLSAWSGCRTDPLFDRVIPGRIVNEGRPPGHLVRESNRWSDFAAADSDLVDVVILGGGVSGLAAAWKLRRSGVERILLLDMDDQLGGTRRSGFSQGVHFPWGAHYINIPPSEADCIHEVLLDIGVIEGYDAAGRPRVASDALLREPRERLFYRGSWVEGLNPLVDASEWERGEHLRFEDEMLRWASYQGQDGRRGFAMPMQYSTADSRLRYLDQISMAQYLRDGGWQNSELRWLVDHACRDDYGARASQVSAWAGIHYYACRFYDKRLAQDYPSDTLTWPAGNGHLVAELARTLDDDQIKRRTLVAKVAEDQSQVRLGVIDLVSGERQILNAKTLVYAGKLHTAPYIIADLPSRQARAMASIEYSPWLVAAIFLKERLEAGKSTWDNVLYESPSLGYVVADHQQGAEGRVLVYYWPFVEDLDQARRNLLAKDHQYWARQIVADLRPAHPEIDDILERIDLYRWGHGMMRPRPGDLWGDEAEWRRQAMERIFFGSCDASGLPLYEEAVFGGLLAAEQAMDRLGKSYRTSLGGLRLG